MDSTYIARAKLDPAIQPVVTVIWSESSYLRDGENMSLAKADLLFRHLDSSFDRPGYDKTKFQLTFTLQGEQQDYEGRQDFGDGEGGLIDHIQAFHQYYLGSNEWHKMILQHDGPEALEQDKAMREYALTEFVPYLRLHNEFSKLEEATLTEIAKLSRLSLPDALDQSRMAYYQAILAYISECRHQLNMSPDGCYTFPPMPKEQDSYTPEMKAYQEQVRAEVAEEAKEAGLTVDEYLKIDWPPSPQPVKVKPKPHPKRSGPSR